MGEKKFLVDYDDDLFLYSFKDIARRTSYHLKTIERFARNGELRSVKINGRRMVTRKALMDFLQTSLEEGILDIE